VVVALIIGLAIIYRAVVKESCSCLTDPGGREEERKKRKKDGYNKVTTSEDSSGDEYFVPPTLTAANILSRPRRHRVSGSNIRDRARTGESAIGSEVLQ
jgi:hypothetical protein